MPAGGTAGAGLPSREVAAGIVLCGLESLLLAVIVVQLRHLTRMRQVTS